MVALAQFLLVFGAGRWLGLSRCSRLSPRHVVTSVTRPIDLEHGVDLTGDGGCVKTTLHRGRPQESYAGGPVLDAPPVGARVQLHYVGWLAANGSQFDSSFDRGSPIEFVLGAGTVIRGWEIAAETMGKGEVALLRCRADYAYGPVALPRYGVPANSTLDFELELVGWEDYPVAADEVDFDEDGQGEEAGTGAVTEQPQFSGMSVQEYAHKLVGAGQVGDPGSPEDLAEAPSKGRMALGDGTAYTFEEDDTSVILRIPIPEAVRSKDVTCLVTRQSLLIDIPKACIHLEGPLKGTVHAEDAYWLIDKDTEGLRCVQVFMDKVHMLPSWCGVVVGESPA